MALNFSIAIYENSDGVDLELDGDFDATSAYELIYAIKKLPEDTVKICINTNGLKKIHPSGLNVLGGFLNARNAHATEIVCTGHNASQISSSNSCPAQQLPNFFLRELRNPDVWNA